MKHLIKIFLLVSMVTITSCVPTVNNKKSNRKSKALSVKIAATGLVGSKLNELFYLKLNEAEGSLSLKDELGKLQGTSVDGAIFISNSGKTGGALSFDGINDRANLGPIDFGGEKLSVSLFMKANSFAISDARLISKASSTSGSDHYMMVSTYKNNSLRFRLKAGGVTSTLFSKTGILTIGKYYHVEAKYDGLNMMLYLDGVNVGTLTKTGLIDSNSNIMVSLGNQPTGAGSRGFDGLIDEVRVSLDLSEAPIPVVTFCQSGDIKQLDCSSDILIQR